MVLKNLFAGQQWKNRRREQTQGTQWGGEEGEGKLYEESNMETYNTIRKIGQPRGICWMTQGTQTGALQQFRGVGWDERWEGGSRGKRHMYT